MQSLFKQPNEKYCCISFNGGVIFSDYTEQEVIDFYTKEIKKRIKQAGSAGEIIKNIESNESIYHHRILSDDQLKAMGFDKPYSELVKFIPRTPLNKNYVSCDFATYGKCPNCGKQVQDGIGHTDKQCPCGQVLKWN